MRKYIKSLFISMVFVISIMIFHGSVSAAGASISIKSNNTVVVGNNITVTVTISSSSSLGAWDFKIGYDTSLLRLVSSTMTEGGQRAVDYAGSSNQKSKTYTLTFKALKSGSARVYSYGEEVYSFNEEYLSTSSGSKTISIKTQAEIEASYSKNNYLSSLKVNDYELSPAFNKETLEYSLDLDSSIESVNVSATVEDRTASVRGDGDIPLVEGINKVEVIVTAQNGSVRTYVININVEEKNPIKVKVDGKEYTVVKRKNALTMPDNYKETTVTISGEEVPALYNEIINYTLVGLKDENGNIKLYIYDIDSDKYTLYQELGFNSNKLFLLNPNEVPNGLKETKIKINDEEVTAYKIDDNSVYYIIYGMILNTGNKDFYMYDSEEHTIQRYNTDMLDKLTKEKDRYLSIVLVLSFVCFLTMLFLLIEINRDNKRKS